MPDSKPDYTHVIKNLSEYVQFSATQQICEPLALLGISGFFYTKRYSDHSFINFATHTASTHIYFSKVFSEEYSLADMQSHVYIEDGVLLTELNPQNKIWQDGKEIHGHGNGILLTQEADHYTEYACFFSQSNNTAINAYYLSNLEILWQFFFYFKEKSSQLISKAEEKYKLFVPEVYVPKNQSQNFYDNAHLTEQFLNIICQKQIRMGKKNSYQKISEKEVECLYWMIQGKSNTEIAIILHKSVKTVEKQIAKLKEKFSCYHTSQLIHIATEQGFDKIAKAIVNPTSGALKDK